MKGWIRWARTGAVIFISIGGIVVLLIWLAGGFREKIEPGPTALGVQPLGQARTMTVELMTVPLAEDAVGTVRAAHETEVGSKIMARVLAVNFQAGQHVEQDQVLVELEKGDLTARMSQSQAAVDAAQASLDQAQTDYDRIVRLRAEDSASELEFTTATNRLSAAKANHEQARSALREADAVIGYATIRSPVTGVVIDKMVDVGDMVRPGQTVLRLFDRLQLVATVRESLATRLEVGQQLPVTLEALDLHCEGTISEIVPESDVLSRAFHVKVTGPCPPGVIPGMFGRLHIPLGERQELRIPQSAVRRVGQIAFVYRDVDGNRVERTFVQLAGEHGDQVAIASGLSPGDRIVVDPNMLKGED
ncbi:MAG: efflux RND transporter periplasmic adaptor subunit [Planctomycetes bacterium]|nr:efflux RND transporter periplasmic adaptor subunit [Planctomycetota bacterium]